MKRLIFFVQVFRMARGQPLRKRLRHAWFLSAFLQLWPKGLKRNF